MILRSTRSFLFFIVLILLSAGCEPIAPGPAQAGGTLVLDLNVIARATGQDAALRDAVAAATSTLNAQLGEVATRLEQQLEAERAKLGKAPSDAEQERLQALALQAQQQYGQTQQLALQRRRDFETGLVRALLDQVRPIAQSIARERGAAVVMVAETQVLWFDPDADITDEIIAEMRARGIEPLGVTEPTPAVPTGGAPDGGTGD